VSASTTALFEHFMANHSPAAVRGGVSQTSADGDAEEIPLLPVAV
ncbi:hypothetical protein ACSLO9_32945, partial [Escherichia coli]